MSLWCSVRSTYKPHQSTISRNLPAWCSRRKLRIRNYFAPQCLKFRECRTKASWILDDFGVCQFNRNSSKTALQRNSPLHSPRQSSCKNLERCDCMHLYATLPVATTNRCLQQNSLDQTKTCCQLLRSTGLSFSICTKTSLLLRSRAHSSWSKPMSTSNPNCGLV